MHVAKSWEAKYCTYRMVKLRPSATACSEMLSHPLCLLYSEQQWWWDDGIQLTRSCCQSSVMMVDSCDIVKFSKKICCLFRTTGLNLACVTVPHFRLLWLLYNETHCVGLSAVSGEQQHSQSDDDDEFFQFHTPLDQNDSNISELDA